MAHRQRRAKSGKECSGGLVSCEQAIRFVHDGRRPDSNGIAADAICSAASSLAECAAPNTVIVSGNGRRGYVKYGCPSHRYRGVCANSVMIRQDRLEDQLLVV